MKYILIQILALGLFFSSFLANAESVVKEKVNKKASIKKAKKTSKNINTQNFKLEYAADSWNKDSSKIDTAFLFVRDASSKKIVKINLEETTPDSSIFTGQFSIAFKDSGIHPQVFIPPQSIRNKVQGIYIYNAKIMKGQIVPKPTHYRVNEKGAHIMDVFDTEEQADKARQLFKQLQAKQLKVAIGDKVELSEEEKEKERIAEETAKEIEDKKKAEELAQKRKMRLRQEQLELQRLQAQKDKLRKESGKKRKQREAQARNISQQALAQYKVGNFKQSEKLFEQSVKLDPVNKENYFYYGVVLYRNKKFEKALLVFNVSKKQTAFKLETLYYTGLTYSSLKDYENAIANFNQVKLAKHPVQSPLASFYKGYQYMAMEKYKMAKEEFEWVLDHSKDPKLDKRAEELIEDLIERIRYQELAKKKIKFTSTAGMTYDSNVLFSPDGEGSQGTATNKAGFRILASGNLDYKLMQKKGKGLNANASTSIIYSMKSEHSTADPLLIGLTMPYYLQGTYAKKGYRLIFTPGYELLRMNSDSSQSRYSLNSLSSFYVKTNWTLVMNKKWFASYILDLRSDNSGIASTDDQNADATKVSITTNHTLVLNKALKKSLLLGGGVISNIAKGKEKKYNRLEASVMLVSPFKKLKDATMMYGMKTYYVDYPSHSSSRADFNLAVSGMLSRPINKSWTWGAMADYSVNSSNVSTSQYSKYTLMGNVTYRWAQ